MYTIIFPIRPWLDSWWVLTTVAIVDSAAMTCVYKYLFKPCFLFVWAFTLKWNHMVILFNFLRCLYTYCFSIVFINILQSHQQCIRISISHLHQHLLFSVGFDLNFFFLMISDANHLFICFLTIYMSSLQKYLFLCPHFWLGYFNLFCSLQSCRNSLCILQMNFNLIVRSLLIMISGSTVQLTFKES